ncbi:MAG: thioredoxin family protein [Nitrospinae bacterium]|nr:thioredoxin family protein [Nitrospinota bacterium]
MKAKSFMGRMEIGVSLFLLSLGPIYGSRVLSPAYGTELPIRGIARGESRIKVGDKAPLLVPDLIKAHEGGKVIALMLGYPSHCPWCDRMDRYIDEIMKETKNFDDRAVFVQRQTEHAKMILPHPEGVQLKAAYGAEGQPWLFIIDKRGIVRFIYLVFVPSEIFKQNITELLGESKVTQVK